MKENNSFDLESSPKWYTDAVKNCLVQRGLTREEALAKMQESGYYEKMKRFPYVQFHYGIEAAADEILYGDDLYSGNRTQKSNELYGPYDNASDTTDYYNLEKINPLKRAQVKACIDIAMKHPAKIAKMFIFGSAVRTDCRKTSDIDICLMIRGTTKCREMYEISRDLSFACDHNCDILTYDKLNDKFKNIIFTTGVMVFES